MLWAACRRTLALVYSVISLAISASLIVLSLAVTLAWAVTRFDSVKPSCEIYAPMVVA